MSNLINHVERIYNELSDSHLDDWILNDLKKDFEIVGEYLGVSDEEAMLFAIIFSFELTNSRSDLRSISKYFSVSDFKSIEFAKVILKLVDKKLCREIKEKRRRNSMPSPIEFAVNNDLFNAIIENKPFPAERINFIPTTIEWLEEMYIFITEELESLSRRDMEQIIDEKLSVQVEGNLPKYLADLNLAGHNKLLIVYAIWDSLVNDDGFTPDSFYTNYGNSRFLMHREKKLMMDGIHPLIKKEIICLQPAIFGNDIEIALTDSFKTELNTYGIELPERNKSNNHLTCTHDQIKDKQLFYNDDENRQLDTITSLLKRENFISLQERMEKKGYPTGVSILLYGGPGTGKTETVFQLARKTGRDIIQVDISQSKSMWFGQSEKLVKKIFSDYKDACKDSELKPILFINEADAILSKRGKVNSTVGQTENTIQNILLEEMEKLEGILFATTNMELNLDKAFERRFLFKVKFERPDVQQRFHIWQSKLKRKNKQISTFLAENFELSGGQIDNVIRKLEIQNLLGQTKFSKNALVLLCQEELIMQQPGTNKIGF